MELGEEKAGGWSGGWSGGFHYLQHEVGWCVRGHFVVYCFVFG